MLRAQEANKYIQDMAEGRMVLDDIGCVADSTGFITSELSNLLRPQGWEMDGHHLQYGPSGDRGKTRHAHRQPDDAQRERARGG